MDHAGLVARRQLIEPTRVALVVAHPFPVPAVALHDNVRMLETDFAVQRHGCTDAVAVEHLHQPEDADAVAVVAHRPLRYVGNGRTATARARRTAVVGARL